jgi:hypothetical protein
MSGQEEVTSLKSVVILNKNETLGLKFDVLDNNKETLIVKEAVKRIEEEVTKFTF